MTPEAVTTFLVGYLHSLAEETRNDKKGIRYGFDHIILQLGQAQNWFPLRLAFHRGGRDGDPKPKKEAEHGVDLKFLSQDRRTMIIFVLKDEPLNYRNCIDEKFLSDLSRAAEQDLNPPELKGVRTIRIILAYNKGDDDNGIKAYDQFVNCRKAQGGSRVKLVFERWNLETLTEQVRSSILNSPAILPERFFRSFSYLCWQVADFSHGSQQWEDVLIPDWKKFLDAVLLEPINERSVRLVSVALTILKSHGKKEPSFETGWIELLEWAMLALWRVARKKNDKRVRKIVLQIWVELYLTSLEEFYATNTDKLNVEHSLAVGAFGDFAQAVASYFSHWHIARLGILALSFLELAQAAKAAKNEQANDFDRGFANAFGRLVGLLNSNPATRRPLLDLHHIQLFLIWRVALFAGRASDALSLFNDVCERLIHRRMGNGGIRLIDQSNDWSNLFEFIATGEAPSASFGRSSYLLQMLLEMCVHSLGDGGHELSRKIYGYLIEGITDDGQSFNFPERVELQSWAPPENWLDRLLEGPVGNLGICITVNSYYSFNELDRSDLPLRIESFVTQSQKAHPFTMPSGIPTSAAILACILHRSPLPPEFWRFHYFRDRELPSATKE